MIRKIIHIDEEKCNGCGACAQACHEGAIGMVAGKAKLLKDDYCDGLGDCLPACPTGAISFVTREAAAYDAQAVAAAAAQRVAAAAQKPGEIQGAASGTVVGLERLVGSEAGSGAATADAGSAGTAAAVPGAGATARRTDVCPSLSFTVAGAGAVDQDPSAVPAPGLQNWPVQIKLAPTWAPYFDGADLLVAADCCAFAYAGFFPEFISGRTVLVGCPKLDAVDYSQKLSAILAQNSIRSVTLARMQVPCCGGLEYALRAALQESGKDLPLVVETISTDGRLLD